jgi:hypothetical protein
MTKLIECQGNLEYMCEGCKRINTEFLRCTAYETPPSLWVKSQLCPHNCKPKEKKKFARVGQQKTKRNK